MAVISLARYVALLRSRELRQTIAASNQTATGSFARGGAATACYVIGLATVAPALGRVIDRSGPRRTLLACALAFPAALSADERRASLAGAALESVAVSRWGAYSPAW